jgi:hypothetical protein
MKKDSGLPWAVCLTPLAPIPGVAHRYHRVMNRRLRLHDAPRCKECGG